MRRTFTVLTVLALTLSVLPAPSAAAPSGGASGVPTREELEQRALAKMAGRLEQTAAAPGAEEGGRGETEARRSDPTLEGTEGGGTEDAGADFDPGVEGRRVPDEWIVAFEPFADPDEAEALARAFGGQAEQRFREVFEGFVFRGPAQAARRLAEHPRIRKVSANGLVEATGKHEDEDEQPSGGGSELVPTGVRRIDADDARAAGKIGSGQRVAVLDTGIDLDHPDLRANIDTSRAKNCVRSDRNADDDHGHGTHVAGIVAAAANGTGVVGVAPGAQVVPVKVLGSDGGGSYSDIICGIDHVVAKGGVGVINMSLSGGQYSNESCEDGNMREAVCAAVGAGIVVVVAAGNNNGNANGRVPARFPEVLAVSALSDSNGAPGGDSFASFSNYGSVVDLIAPGNGIRSTTRGGGYGEKNGTSMAAPHVAGAAALARASGVGAGGVRARLLSTGECPNTSVAGSDQSCSGQGTWSGDGESRAEPLVNALRAAGGGGGGTTPPPDEPDEPTPGQGSAPTVSISVPTGGSVSGTIRVEAKADDAEDGRDALTVRYSIDGTTQSGALSHRKKGIFEGSWNTTTVIDGSRTLRVTVTDSDGNATSDSVTVTVANGGGGSAPDEPEDPPPPDPDPGTGTGPSLTVLQPAPDATLGLKETVVARASDGEDAVGTLRVAYEIDGSGQWVTMTHQGGGEYGASWKTDNVGPGPHTLRVRAIDSAGNPTVSNAISVTVEG